MAQGAGIILQSWTPNNANNVVVIDTYTGSSGDINQYPYAHNTPRTLKISLGTTVVFRLNADAVLNSVDSNPWTSNIPGGGGATNLNGNQPGDVFGQLCRFTFTTLGNFSIQSRFRQAIPGQPNAQFTASINVNVVPADTNGVGILVSGQSSINSTYTTQGNPYENINGLPASITVLTGNPIDFSSAGSPIPVFNPLFYGNFLTGPALESITPPTADASPTTVVWARPGTTQMLLDASTSDNVRRTSSNMQITINWGLIDQYDLKFVASLAEAWESLPVYNTKYANGNPVDTSTYTGWSAPIAAADQLDYFRRKTPSGQPQYFPDYIGPNNIYDFMSETWKASVANPAVNSEYPDVLQTYGYPSWHRFTLDKFRPARNAVIQDYDQTDFGWWMNTSNLGNLLTIGTNDPNYLGTTTLGLYEGLDGFYARSGHANVVSGVFKNSNKTLGTLPAEYVSGAENNLASYEQMVVNLVNADKPFIILVSGNPSVISAPTQDPNSSYIRTAEFLGSGFVTHFAFQWASGNMYYSVEIVSGFIDYYYTTASDTPATVAAGIYNMLNSVNWAARGYSSPGPSFALNGTTLDIFNDAFHGINFYGYWVTGTGTAPGVTPDTIASSTMNPNVGAEYIRDIVGMQFTSSNANWQMLNDPNNTYHQLTPIGGLSGNPDTATGNAYMVIGYCKPSPNSYLPVDARNKFLVICKNTGNDREENIYFTLDQSLTGTAGDNSLWDRLIASYIVSPTYFSYVSPRPKIDTNNLPVTKNVCVGVPVTLLPPISGGHDNRFTNVYDGIGLWQDITNPVTYTTPGNYQVRFKLTDGVSHSSLSFNYYTVHVLASVNPQFDVRDTFGDLITGMPLPIANNTVYTYTPTSPINNAFSYTWSVTRTDGPQNPSDFTFVSGTPTTKGAVQIRFNNTGQYTVSLATSGNASTSCPGQYTIPVKVDTVTLDFTYSNPAFLALPIQFNGLCNVAVSNWAWTFGDGGSESGVNSQNPVHTYNSIGSMTVVLTVMTLYGQFSVTKIVDIYPAQVVADFTYKPLTNIVVGETISFLDLSTPQPVPGVLLGEWAWNFGDGVTSNSQNPSHAYSAPGVYNVTLTYTIFFGPGFTLTRTGSVTKQLTIQSGAPIVKSQTFIVSRNLIDTYNFSNFTTSSNPITYSIVKQPANGVIEQVNPTTINYQPNTNYVGPDVLTFRATDSFGLFTNGNINLIVRPPVLTVIVGEVLNAANIITIRLGTTDVNQLLLKDVVIQNTGTGDLLISNMSIIDDVAGVFLLFDNSFGQVNSINNVLLKPREIFGFKVGIISATAGTYTAKLQVDHN